MPFNIEALCVLKIDAEFGPKNNPDPSNSSAWLSLSAIDAYTRGKSEVTFVMSGDGARAKAQAYADAINAVTAQLVPPVLMPCGREKCGDSEWCGEQCPHPNPNALPDDLPF